MKVNRPVVDMPYLQFLSPGYLILFNILAAITFGAVMSIAKILAVLIMFYFSCVEALPVSMKRQ